MPKVKPFHRERKKDAKKASSKALQTVARQPIVQPVQNNPFVVKITTSNSLQLHAKLKDKLTCISIFSHEWFSFVFAGYWYQDVEARLTEIDRRVREVKGVLCPPSSRIWRWAELLDNPLNVRVVIIGQDPYTQVAQTRPASGADMKSMPTHGTPMADGLAFSVSREYAYVRRQLPPSLTNILRAVRVAQNLFERQAAVPDVYHSDNIPDIPGFGSDALGREVNNGNLESWCRQGVLLLNNTLTAPGGSGSDNANSHKDIGWQFVTDAVIRRLGSKNMPHRIFFMLWGRFAQDTKGHLISSAENKKEDEHASSGTLHRIYKTHHPSPLAVNRYGEFPNDQFVICNKLLIKDGGVPIRWI